MLPEGRAWGLAPLLTDCSARAGCGERALLGYLERSWLEPRLSTGETLAECAECRRGACLLGDVARDSALDLVRDRERLFFFFSWGLLRGRVDGGGSEGMWCSPRAASLSPPHTACRLQEG